MPIPQSGAPPTYQAVDGRVKLNLQQTLPKGYFRRQFLHRHTFQTLFHLPLLQIQNYQTMIMLGSSQSTSRKYTVPNLFFLYKLPMHLENLEAMDSRLYSECAVP